MFKNIQNVLITTLKVIGKQFSYEYDQNHMKIIEKHYNSGKFEENSFE